MKTGTTTRMLAKNLILSLLVLSFFWRPSSAAAAPGAGGECPDIHAIGNFQISNVVGASFTINGLDPTQATYNLDTASRDSTNGVPGIISYCIYVAPQLLPNSAAAIAIGADNTSLQTAFKASQGYFAFRRSNGDPSNIPLDGTTGIIVGTATWMAGVPTPQTILLHINDAAECDHLYGGNAQTCFVFP